MDTPKTQQVKSRERVQKHGEVFTNEREVNAMLDLVKHETERIDSRFLEPACGDGNFLAEILRRKLRVCRNLVEQRKNTQLEYEKNTVLAVSSIYGIELLPDNAMTCRERLFRIFCDEYHALWRQREGGMYAQHSLSAQQEHHHWKCTHLPSGG